MKSISVGRNIHLQIYDIDLWLGYHDYKYFQVDSWYFIIDLVIEKILTSSF